MPFNQTRAPFPRYRAAIADHFMDTAVVSGGGPGSSAASFLHIVTVGRPSLIRARQGNVLSVYAEGTRSAASPLRRRL